MTSTSSNHQQPPTSTAEFSGNQPAHTNQLDPNTHRPTSGSYAPNDNQLAGLVEAATAAAGQDVSEWAAAAAVAAAAGQQHQLEGYGPDMHIEDDGFGDTGFGGGMGPGSRRAASEHGPPSGLSRTVSKKRKRGEDPLDPALAASSAGVGLSSSRRSSQHQQHHQYEGDSLDIRAVPPQSLSEARAVGVHSAAALFRQPSNNKKYTRPPMSKMFSSLELSPENFLHLQAAAKGFMLDDEHPERRECVGQRGKGDTEMVKLRLWNCVRHFLEVEGHGERFFGEHVVNEGMGPRAHIWPRDQQKIISLVIPLLRRMVTNERQRQYANETRKGGGTEERRRRKTDENLQVASADNSLKLPPEESLQMQTQHHLPEEFPSQGQMGQMQQPLDMGLTDLLLGGYPTDWNALSKSYDMYNHDYELDNLWSVSGLQQPDWRGLVAAVDSHYQVVHNGDYQCPSPCEDENISRIIGSDSASGLRWRVGGRSGQSARNEFGSSITRDVSRIIRESLAGKHGTHSPHDQERSTRPSPFHQHQQFGPLPGAPNATDPSTSSTTAQIPICLRLNILQNGKRILPRFDLPAEQCPDLETMKQLITRRFAGQLPSEPGLDPWRSVAAWKFKVWLPDGLAPVQNDGEWTIALLSAGTVDWMDGDLRVLVEIEGSSSS